LFPQLKGKLCVVYNAKNREDILARAQETVDDERIRQRYILSVERLEESQKDITTLLKAYQLLRENYQHTEKLYLLGKGNSEQELRLLADQLGLSDSVEFLGFHANPFPWILHSSLLVHSAKFEGLPTILIEGLMLDKLMVATDCPTGPREILNDGKAGLLVPVGDAAALASSMHEALTDTATQQSLLRQVRSHRERFLFTHTEVLFKQLAEGLLQ
jgi:glycosyltransferase involved in cell wall biosynthesis